MGHRHYRVCFTFSAGVARPPGGLDTARPPLVPASLGRRSASLALGGSPREEGRLGEWPQTKATWTPSGRAGCRTDQAGRQAGRRADSRQARNAPAATPMDRRPGVGGRPCTADVAALHLPQVAKRWPRWEVLPGRLLHQASWQNLGLNPWGLVVLQ